MRCSTLLTLLLPMAALEALPVDRLIGQEQPLEARVWLDRGEEPVVQRGDMVRVYYRTSEDAYAAIFRIDTDGVISMVFPQHPGVVASVQGGRDYRLIFPNGTLWLVDEDPGAGNFFIVASPEPLDFTSFRYDQRRGWDLGSVGSVVYEDPYVAIDDYVAELVPDWEVVPYALDFLTYHVGNTFSYPRFLCYDCHDAQRYASWNPYDAVCTSVRVVIWDDPYFYPSYRYSGTSVVVARPARALPRYEVVARRADDIGVRPLVRPRQAPERGVAQFKEAPPVQESSRVPVRRTTQPTAAQAPQPSPGTSRGARAATAGASERPTLQRRAGAGPTVDETRTSASGAPRARATATVPGRQEPEAERPDAFRPERRASPTQRPSAPLTPRAGSSRPSASPPTRSSAPARGTRGSSASPTAPASARPSPRPATRLSGSSPSERAGAARGSAPSKGTERPSARPAAPPTSRPAARPTPTRSGAAARPAVRPRAVARGN